MLVWLCGWVGVVVWWWGGGQCVRECVRVCGGGSACVRVWRGGGQCVRAWRGTETRYHHKDAGCKGGGGRRERSPLCSVLPGHQAHNPRAVQPPRGGAIRSIPWEHAVGGRAGGWGWGRVGGRAGGWSMCVRGGDQGGRACVRTREGGEGWPAATGGREEERGGGRGGKGQGWARLAPATHTHRAPSRPPSGCCPSPHHTPTPRAPHPSCAQKPGAPHPAHLHSLRACGVGGGEAGARAGVRSCGWGGGGGWWAGGEPAAPHPMNTQTHTHTQNHTAPPTHASAQHPPHPPHPGDKPLLWSWPE